MSAINIEWLAAVIGISIWQHKCKQGISMPAKHSIALTACMGKAVFESFDVAKRRAKRLRGRSESIQHPYVCPNCHKIHIGGTNMRERRVNHKEKKRKDHEQD